MIACTLSPTHFLHIFMSALNSPSCNVTTLGEKWKVFLLVICSPIVGLCIKAFFVIQNELYVCTHFVKSSSGFFHVPTKKVRLVRFLAKLGF